MKVIAYRKTHANIIIHLSPERSVQSTGIVEILPIEGEGEQSQSFVNAGSTKEMLEEDGVRLGNAEDTESTEKREHILRNEFVDEHNAKDNKEPSELFVAVFDSSCVGSL